MQRQPASLVSITEEMTMLRWTIILALSLCGPSAAADARKSKPKVSIETSSRSPTPAGPRGPEALGRKQYGQASFYASKFNNRKMADGRRLNPNANIAASKTLPLGTTARITNLQNGKSVTVRVQDRGPFVPGRVVDVTPRVADALGMRKQGVVPVVVAPITLPHPDGSVRLGDGAAESTPAEVREAMDTTRQLMIR